MTDALRAAAQQALGRREAGGRQDLADIEKAELVVLNAYMPAGLSDEEIARMLQDSFSTAQQIGRAHV